MIERRASIANPNVPRESVEAFLPDNYRLEYAANGGSTIVGHDVAGWTLDGYVIPRLASGLIFATELPAHNCEEHPVPYVSDGPLGHGWECGVCGAFLQAG